MPDGASSSDYACKSLILIKGRRHTPSLRINIVELGGLDQPADTEMPAGIESLFVVTEDRGRWQRWEVVIYLKEECVDTRMHPAASKAVTLRQRVAACGIAYLVLGGFAHALAQAPTYHNLRMDGVGCRERQQFLDAMKLSPDAFANLIVRSRALRGALIVESRPAFRSRLLFTDAEPLDRARFPKNVARARVPLDWAPPPETPENSDNAACTVQRWPPVHVWAGVSRISPLQRQ